jgi:hypothetical protein
MALVWPSCVPDSVNAYILRLSKGLKIMSDAIEPSGGENLRYSITFEVDKDFLVDQETVDTEFDGSWQKWLDWFAKEELGEVMTGVGTDPISIKVEEN